MPTKDTDPYDRANRYRQVFLRAVTEADIEAIAQKLVEQARAGDRIACRYLLDRVLGPTQVDEWPSEAGIALASQFRKLAAGA